MFSNDLDENISSVWLMALFERKFNELVKRKEPKLYNKDVRLISDLRVDTSYANTKL